ncbi:unnamed protein product [Calicophoron daubneyi]
MLSRTLGPEFGGAVGTVFYFAQVCATALYISGFVEALVANFGPKGLLADGALPGDGRWWIYLYATVVMAVCLIILLVGSKVFSKVLIFILAVVVVVIACAFGSFFQHGFDVPVPRTNLLVYNGSELQSFVRFERFTGLNIQSLKENSLPSWSEDYTTGLTMTFLTVFAVFFSSVTGIMNGANMSGELRNPARSIPLGTLGACTFTFVVYLTFAIFSGASCSRKLLQNNYLYLQGICFYSPIVVTGVFATTLSAALGSAISASRILEALARDELFGVLLRPVLWTTKSGNPVPAVLVSCFLSQVILLIGRLNAIAPLVSILFMLSYASVNLACFALDAASAANFRPTFRYFHWGTALLGMIGCLTMCLFIEPIYTLVAVMILTTLVFVLYQRHLEYSWGSIGQALIFHQVRKYLLLLDPRKEHVKFWRLQLILLVSDPRISASLVQFMNSVKKGGLYVIGHAIYGDPSKSSDEPDICVQQRWYWTRYAQLLKAKAFVEITMDTNIRRALSHLVRIAGLGAMRPNTVCLGFHETEPPTDILRYIAMEQRNRAFLSSRRAFDSTADSTELLPVENENHCAVATTETINSLEELPPPFTAPLEDETNPSSIFQSADSPRLKPEEYVNLLCEILNMEMSLVLARHFDRVLFEQSLSGWAKLRQRFRSFPLGHSCKLRGNRIAKADSNLDLSSDLSNGVYVMPAFEPLRLSNVRTPCFDIWPVDLLSVVDHDFSGDECQTRTTFGCRIDRTGLFLLQLACLVARSPHWRNRHFPPRLRVFYPLPSPSETADDPKISSLATATHHWLIRLLKDLRITADIQLVTFNSAVMNHTLDAEASIGALNRFLLDNCHPETTAVFLYLPKPPRADREVARTYLNRLNLLTKGLPPTLMAYGVHDVTSTAL